MSEIRVTSHAHSITPRATALIGSLAVIGASAIVVVFIERISSGEEG
jgi:hypothetical protein